MPLTEEEVNLTNDIIQGFLEPVKNHSVTDKPLRKTGKRKIGRKFGRKMYKCAICGYESLYTTNYNSHMLKHRNLKPYSCSFQGCIYKTDRKWNVDLHFERTHKKKC